MTNVLKIKYINVGNCFLYLNENILKKIDCMNVYELKFGKKFNKFEYFTISSQASIEKLENEEVGISSKYAQILGITNQSEVLISPSSKHVVSSVFVRPLNNDDKEIIESCRDTVERKLLDQVRVVRQNQLLPIKVSRYIEIIFFIEKLEPDFVHGFLEQGTELVVLELKTETEKEEKIISSTDLLDDSLPLLETDMLLSSSYASVLPSQPNTVKHIFSENEFNKKNFTARILKEKLNSKKNKIYKVLPANILENVVSDFDKNYFYVTDESLFSNNQTQIICSLEKIQEFNKVDEIKDKLESKVCNLKLNFTDYKIFEEFHYVYLSRNVMNSFDLELGSIINLQLITNPDIEVNAFDATETPCYVEKDIKLWTSLSSIQSDILNILNTSKSNINVNVLIVGDTGSGKTVLLDSIQRDIEKLNCIFCEKIDCKQLKSKKVESLEKLFSQKLSMCAYHEPSLLLLDSLDSYNSMNLNTDQDSTFGTNYINRITNLLVVLVERYQLQHKLNIVATAQSLDKLGPELNSSRGSRLFEHVFEIPVLDASDRKEILVDFFNKNKFLTVEKELVQDIVDRSENYNVQDLSDLVDKLRIKSLLRKNEALVNLTSEDVDNVLSEHVPLSLNNVELNKNLPHSWDDVGGLGSVKQTLIEILEWSTKYSVLFNSCPLRHQSGVLLYGAPGTGKTLLAGAVANKCKLNFISVKGPELLSKYIGASEEGVRSLFDRAQRAKPCILFFDEFDSLAPRRGHDSTGVTDRVVNQLLTQLDGVESLNGVWVLAATSRPDLLDPALLRPGRLDKSVLCPIPNKCDRLSILNCLSKHMTLSDVDMEVIADLTEGYTGADLHAVLYNAQMSALNQNTDSEYISDSLQVTHSHVVGAVHSTKPSLNASEKLKYEKIYKRFISSGGNDFSDESSQQKKVTLA